MPKINLLDRHIAELIAAGEVVDRPCSVVKELVENSIDAGADTITVEIKDGGNTFIRVTDNGCGIEPEDIPKAFLRHATSKIHEEWDLDRIMTFGFRGEALASVAAVSHVEIMTRTKDSAVGYCCDANDEGVTDVEESGCPEGTTIIVRDLFYNTPARQKFLKKDVTEANAIAQVMDKMALSYPEVKFRFIRDGEIKLTTYGNGDLLAVISAVYGREFAKETIAVNYSPVGRGKMKVTGFITKPTSSKPSRTFQNFFVNRRYVKTRTAMAALEEAFKGSAMVGKYPGCVLNLEIPPETVDVNVHPAKTEVRFISEKEIFDLVYYGVKSALNTRDISAVLEESKKANKTFWSEVSTPEEKEHFENVVIQTTLPVQPKEQPAPINRKPSYEDIKYKLVENDNVAVKNNDTIVPYRIDGDITHTVQYKIRQAADKAANEGTEIPKEYLEGLDTIKEAGAPVPEIPRQIDKKYQSLGNLKYVGEVFKTYILLESEEELVFVDKHAAHERILYEKLRAGIDAFDCQYLLSPMTCNLSDEQKEAVIENPDEMKKFGFIIDDFGRGTVLVRSLPFWVKAMEAESIIGEIAESIVSCKHDLTPEKLNNLYANISCRAAIKANDKNSQPELETIVEILLNDPNIKYCPHGRPVSITVSKNKLERMFGRQQ
ncbi:MAG: DNA mismatch repair endonuclease MutL [Oscillospiraceae bacterium]|nr:DNA mismatch repair endonuclease MutL [Oscillospiraceae bacterium]